MIDVKEFQFEKFDDVKKDFLEAYRTYLGNITLASKSIGYSYQRIHQMRQEDPSFEAAIKLMRKDVIGYVEGKLSEKIQGGNTTAIIFWLKTQHRKKWGERIKLGTDPDNPLQVHATIDAKCAELSAKYSKPNDTNPNV